MSLNWKESKNASSLEAKFVFEGYETLRDFLDDVAQLTEEMEVHPNISFGRDYASLIIYAQNETLSEQERDVAAKILNLVKSD
ncbi:MAG: 4a-hydroxytetrahydrobiopterin dehydratase [Thiomicrospira sp.]|uniref:4a-hydroxytetrahydrobiopterin dehydratase n=1 Tax=Thiomicrospira sp. TaxID=935 RepID=UPI0019F3E765|nr:4a-hydroxytetrahydrobiopterin dehydratase [Thiomicrospira sp.]MBE0492855.1 4a-hydroxytetrahydrobiopterin dehydratase [Thiomicrospira sp.]